MTLLASFLGGWLIPIIANNSGIGNAFGAGALSCVLSFINSMFLICIDKRATEHDTKLIDRRNQAIKYNC